MEKYDCLSTPSLRRRKRSYAELLLPPGVHPSATPILINRLITFSRRIISQAHHNCRQLLQQRNLCVLARRIKILVIFLEELVSYTPSASALPPSALLCFRELHVILHGMQLLSVDCTESSRMGLLMEHRRISEFFYRLTQEMATALEILPLELLDVSCDAREQLDLMRKQAKRSSLYVGRKEARLCAEVQAAMAQIERKEATPEGAKLAEIFESLELSSAVDCERELDRLRDEEREGVWNVVVSSRRNAEDREVPLSDLISFVRYCKCILFGATEIVEDDDDDDSMQPADQEPDIKIPLDFRCPISLELMRDPVVVATGQTYERAEITRWFNGNNLTCPKSGLVLAHTVLTPNYALRNLIRLWCARHNVRFCSPSDRQSCYSSVPTSPTAMEVTKLTAEFLLRQLLTASPDAQRHIASEFRVLAKCSSESRKVIAEVGAIPMLLPLLSAPDARTKEHAVTAIFNLSIYAPNKERILQVEGAMDSVIELMRASGSEDVTEAARENATAVLFSLSQVMEAAAEMGKKADAVEGLLEMVKEGRGRGKKDAVSALFNMAVLYKPNRAVLVKAGVVRVVMGVLVSADQRGAMEEEGLAMMAVLAAGEGEGRGEMAAMSSAMVTLVDLLQRGSEKGKENAVAILACLCRHDQGLRASLYGALPYLQSLVLDGTPRARRKANSLLHLLLR